MNKQIIATRGNQILKAYNDRWDTNLALDHFPNLPTGVTFAADVQGVERTVFFDQVNDLVFKFGDLSANSSEFDNAVELATKLATHPLFRVPQVYDLDDYYICMEYIRGDWMGTTDESFRDWEESGMEENARSATGLIDCHAGNFIKRGEHYYMVDLTF